MDFQSIARLIRATKEVMGDANVDRFKDRVLLDNLVVMDTALAVSLSESNGDVRVFNRGKLFMEIEKRGEKILDQG